MAYIKIKTSSLMFLVLVAADVGLWIGFAKSYTRTAGYYPEGSYTLLFIGAALSAMLASFMFVKLMHLFSRSRLAPASFGKISGVTGLALFLSSSCIIFIASVILLISYLFAGPGA